MMKKFLLALLLAAPIAYADDYPTCDPDAADHETSCPVCFEAGNTAIEDAPADQQVVCAGTSADE
jgi:predicted outer membrane protein